MQARLIKVFVVGLYLLVCLLAVQCVDWEHQIQSGIYTPTPTNSSVLMDDSAPTLTPIFTPTPTVIPVNTSSFVGVGYDFESDTQGWNTSEEAFKLARLDVTTAIVHSGGQALEMTTELYGNNSEEFKARGSNDVYLHTEATAYFNNARPRGIETPGPYDLTGRKVSCFIYLPSGLALDSNPQAYVRIFVKDDTFRNQFGDPQVVEQANVEQWLPISLEIGRGEGMDPGFDSARVNTLGIRIDLQNNSTLVYQGSIYIDDCVIE